MATGPWVATSSHKSTINNHQSPKTSQREANILNSLLILCFYTYQHSHVSRNLVPADVPAFPTTVSTHPGLHQTTFHTRDWRWLRRSLNMVRRRATTHKQFVLVHQFLALVLVLQLDLKLCSLLIRSSRLPADPISSPILFLGELANRFEYFYPSTLEGFRGSECRIYIM